ncbi:MAG: peptidylprolyl isomerase, partial [Clostridia bacterium]|nr:peptidylprolyl isomerase [Clostridia bacterium]
AEPTEAPTAEPTEAPTAEPTAEPVAEAAAAAETAQEAAAADETMTLEETAEEVAAHDDVILAHAYNGEVNVMLSEVKEEFDQMLQEYIEYYAQYGYQMDEYDVDFQNDVANETVQTKLTMRIAERHAADTGFVITEEIDAELKAQVDSTLEATRTYLSEMLVAYYGYEGEMLEAAVEEQLLLAGYNYDTLYESARLAAVLEHIYELGIEGVTVTDEEVKAAFDAKVADQTARFADVDTFINTYLAGAEEILYTPEGVRRMHCIYIELDENEATPAEASAGEAVDPAEMTGLAKANAVAAKAKAGEDFTALMEAYNEDASTPEQMAAGYPVAEGSVLYGEEFQTGAMSAANIGDVTDVIVTNYGYFILKYVEDFAAGAVDFEARKEAETEAALTNKQNDAYTAYVNNMIEQSGMVVNDLSPLFNVYEAQPDEPLMAYAATSAETILTDMPAGDAIATLAAGTSLEVLGYIGVDGEEYAFAAVPGTACKGYVKVGETVNMEPDAAMSADNTALVTAAPAVDKLPTFTIVMNGGALIYGELYPDVTPESVGNFIALANAGFYDGLIFHRVIPGFMIQGGDPNGDGTGGPGYAIKGEFSNNGVENALSHTRGVLSMARSSAMDSAGSQFFIMHADNDYLDGDYAGFGLVLGGIENVDLIASVPTDSSDKPRTAQIMRTVYVETYGQEYAFTKLED